ncbi:hypothetical protein TWF696_008123 [Orbilia brochopaga]|uniref:Uncharacterized protein n=1 Tax=Orbilia brochopaga TaxID=3140254 RepID=A0AAV9UM94_9PEZI
MSEHFVSTDVQILGYKAILINSQSTDTTGSSTSLTGTFDVLHHPFADRYLTGTLGQLCSSMDVAPHIVEEAHREIARIQGSETDTRVKWVFEPRVYMRDSNFTFCLQKILDPAAALLTDAHQSLHLHTTSSPLLGVQQGVTAMRSGGCCCGRLSFQRQQAMTTDDEMDLSSMSDAPSHHDILTSKDRYTSGKFKQGDEGDDECHTLRKPVKKESTPIVTNGDGWKPLLRDRKRVRIDTDGQPDYLPPLEVKRESHDACDGNGHDYVEGPFGETAN